jgi:AraC-like DNA-binding protein
MPGTLLAVGAWHECNKFIASAMSNGWSVLHALLFEDISTAMQKVKVDLILLSGCSSRADWERAAYKVWAVHRDTPIVALSTENSQNSLISALFGAASLDGFDNPCSRSALSPTLTLLEPMPSNVSVEIKCAVDFIESHYAEAISLADAAKVASYSRCHFCKLFKEQMGVSFVSYLSRVRIGHAANLLTRSDKSITEIAFAVGFNDVSHFERVFRAIEGQPPSHFRRHAKNLQGSRQHLPNVVASALT